MKKTLSALVTAMLMLVSIANAEFYTVNTNPPVYNMGFHLTIAYNTNWPGYPVEYVTIICPGGSIGIDLDVGYTSYFITNNTSLPYVDDPYVANYGTYAEIDVNCPSGTYEVTVYGGSLNGWVY